MQLVEETATLPALTAVGIGFNVTVGPVVAVSDAKAAVQYDVDVRSPLPSGGDGLEYHFTNVTVWCGRSFFSAEPARIMAQALWKQQGPIVPAPTGALPQGLLGFIVAGQGLEDSSRDDAAGAGVGGFQQVPPPVSGGGGSGVGAPLTIVIALLTVMCGMGAPQPLLDCLHCKTRAWPCTWRSGVCVLTALSLCPRKLSLPAQNCLPRPHMGCTLIRRGRAGRVLGGVAPSLSHKSGEFLYQTGAIAQPAASSLHTRLSISQDQIWPPPASQCSAPFATTANATTSTDTPIVQFLRLSWLHRWSSVRGAGGAAVRASLRRPPSLRRRPPHPQQLPARAAPASQAASPLQPPSRSRCPGARRPASPPPPPPSPKSPPRQPSPTRCPPPQPRSRSRGGWGGLTAAAATADPLR